MLKNIIDYKSFELEIVVIFLFSHAICAAGFLFPIIIHSNKKESAHLHPIKISYLKDTGIIVVIGIVVITTIFMVGRLLWINGKLNSNIFSDKML